jgi:hypothetical protein
MYTSDAQLSPIGAIEEFGAFDDDRVDVGESATDEHAYGRSYDQAQALHRKQMQKTKARGRNRETSEGGITGDRMVAKSVVQGRPGGETIFVVTWREALVANVCA